MLIIAFYIILTWKITRCFARELDLLNLAKHLLGLEPANHYALSLGTAQVIEKEIRLQLALRGGQQT